MGKHLEQTHEWEIIKLVSQFEMSPENHSAQCCDNQRESSETRLINGEMKCDFLASVV